MATRGTAEEILKLLLLCKKVMSGPRRGVLVFVRVDEVQKLYDFAIKVARALSLEQEVPIYLVQGQFKGEYGWPFERIRQRTRLRLLPDGKIVGEISGVIFPQDRPIVLLVECFDHLEPSDQRAYAHLVDGEGREYALYDGSILIAGLLSSKEGQVEPGTANRGVHFDLT